MGYKFRDGKGKDVDIAYDKASSYWMVIYNHEILDQTFPSYNAAKEFVICKGCLKRED